MPVVGKPWLGRDGGAAMGVFGNHTGYNELNRLKQAYTTAGAAFNQEHSIDGFGNFYYKNQLSGSDDPVNLSIDQSKNRINSSGYSYDANGNMTARPALGGGSNAFTFDVDNRLLTAAVAGGTEEYNYLADNKRVWKKEPSGTEYVYFYGAGGQKLATYQVVSSPFSLTQVSLNVYFGGKLIRADGVAVASDRLGSVMGRAAAADSASVTSHDYFPYGAEIGGATSGNRDKFGAYHRDQSTGLDYADQRYYASGNGRFLSADPYEASGGAGEPGSWNRYPYVGGDPVNWKDSRGLAAEDPFAQDTDRMRVITQPYTVVGRSPSPMEQIFMDWVMTLGAGTAKAAHANATNMNPDSSLSGAPGTSPCLQSVALSPSQQALLGGQAWDALSSSQQVAFLNFTANAAATGLDLSGFNVSSFGEDRIQLTGTPGAAATFLEALTGNSNYTSHRIDPLVGAPHTDYTENFRQNTATNSMQVNINPSSGTIELDIDYYNPSFGVAPLIAHGLFEVLRNRISGGHTDPFKVASGLRKSGMNVGHTCDRYNR